jgi:hypothetical protein
MVFNLVGQLQRTGNNNHEIVVVSPVGEVIAQLKERLGFCKSVLGMFRPNIRYHAMSLDAYLSLSKEPVNKGNVQHFGLFDFIEYNGGLSKYPAEYPAASDSIPRFPTQLQGLHRLLQDETGVLGLTYFAHNVHVSRIRSLVDSRNLASHVPYSLEAYRLVRTYLEAEKLTLFREDHEMLHHLGSESVVDSPFVKRKLSEVEPRVQWKALRRNETEALLTEADFTIASWVPTAFSHPFGTYSTTLCSL